MRLGLGDWTVNENKLPGGLKALVPRIQKLGMSFGIWIEPEMVSEDSSLYRAQPPAAAGAALDEDVGVVLAHLVQHVVNTQDVAVENWT